MTRIVVFGAGKLGQAIISAARQNPGAIEGSSGSEPSVQVVAAVDQHLLDTAGEDALSVPLYGSLTEVKESFDVVVDSSRAEALSEVLDFVLDRKLPLVVAATGHDDVQLAQLAQASAEIPILRSSNLSVGVNVVRRLVEEATEMLGPVDTEIIETHHRMKADAPSGTALTLAEAVRKASSIPREFVYGRSPSTPGARGHEIGIHAVRGGTVVGEHTVRFLMDDEIVEITHIAQSRLVFGFGALKAAEFVQAQVPGLYSMEDLLG